MNSTFRTRGRLSRRALALILLMIMITAASVRLHADTGTCGGQLITLPFTDVAGNSFFCSIAEAYFSALTNGTAPTTFSPSNNVTRDQMTAFITRTMDQSVKRGSKRAALDQYWTTQGTNNLGLTLVSNQPLLLKSDGADLWVASFAGASVSRVRASDGKLLQTWSGATSAYGVLVAMGKVFITGETNPGKLYQIDPTVTTPGAVTTFSSALGVFPQGIAFDGLRIWTSNFGVPGSVSIVSLNPTTITTVTTGFVNLTGIIYDGANIWVTDAGDHTLKRLDSNGAILLSIPMGASANPQYPAFDGTNIWVPNLNSNALVVVRATGSLAGTVLATLTGNGLNGPISTAFDGERILSANLNGSSVSLWKASDFTPIGTASTGSSTNPYGACSDGLNFWVSLSGSNRLARF